MTTRMIATVDGNEAVASVAHRLTEVNVIYPITPSSPMGELADEWSAKGRTNVWGRVPEVVEMQSEAGAAGAVHGVLQAGSLATTYTASQGLLLMIPNMYKIAGELNPFVMHVAARTVATHALSIFGDHSDVMACRQVGFAMLCAANVQEAHDFALLSHACTLETRVPFLHFFDGFRTSHEVSKIEILNDEDLLNLMDEAAIRAHRERALSPEAPKIRGTAQNPDTYFQAREACNGYYDAVPHALQRLMNRFGKQVGRSYRLYDYHGHPDAERVIIAMGSGCEAIHETVDHLVSRGEKVGLLKVRLYRPFAADRFLDALPSTVRSIAVLDRTKEPGALGDPLYLDVATALRENEHSGQPRFEEPVRLVGGRYGLSSKEFDPAMVMSIYENLASPTPRNHFTVGIMDDVTYHSLSYDAGVDIEPEEVVRCVFYGLGADGTVGANKNSIKIIGEETDNYAQGYFVYDSKKSGAMTISHLRFGPKPIRSTYLVKRANFIGVHQWEFIDRFDILDTAETGATLLINSPYPQEKVWDHLPLEVQQTIIEKRLKVYVIDAYQVGEATGMGRRINTIMQTCFFAISGVLPREEAIAKIKQAIEKTYARKGREVVEQNFAAVDQTLDHLHELEVPATVTTRRRRPPIIAAEAPDFVQKVEGVMLAGKGDLLPVSAFPVDGTWPLGTTRWEKRNIATEIPVWEEDLCIQCNKCALVCPHAAIRAKVYDPAHLADAPENWQAVDYKAADFRGQKYTLQVAPEDCTGCNLCVSICPASDKQNPDHKAINMAPQRPIRDQEKLKWDYFLELPEVDRTTVRKLDARGSQFMLPLLEFSGACAGCGETPYLKLVTQLFGDRAILANATGCSSIWGGNLPTTPYCMNEEGRGPAWSNSLFEDNAEFGFGMRVASDFRKQRAQAMLKSLASQVGESLVEEIIAADEHAEHEVAAQRLRLNQLREKLKALGSPEAERLLHAVEDLARKSIWLIGGDGWAYDIGYGGLDHVLASGRDVNILVLDTEVYSNTGGQASKATPLAAAAKFAASGKAIHKKDLGLIAMTYGHVYVASVALGAKDNQTVQALTEAESYPGPSLVIAYSHCIAHGYDLGLGLNQQKLAVDSGMWPLYRYDPRRAAEGKPPLQLDSKPGKVNPRDYMVNEARYTTIARTDPERFEMLTTMAEEWTARRINIYEQLSKITM